MSYSQTKKTTLSKQLASIVKAISRKILYPMCLRTCDFSKFAEIATRKLFSTKTETGKTF